MAKHPLPSPIFDTLAHVKLNHGPLPKGTPFALDDFQCALDFLCQYDGNLATFNSYRREIERLLHWSWLIQQKSILSLQRDDMSAYVKFCINPLRTWIGFKKVARFNEIDGVRVTNTQWRPFVVTKPKSQINKHATLSKDEYSLSPKSIKEIFVVLGSFYNYLLLEGKAEYNPIASIRQKSKFIRRSQTAPQIPRLSKQQWQAVVKAAEALALEEPGLHERTLFMLHALYLMYLRISELTANERWTPLMSHFYKDGNENWWFVTVGKGNKERHIPVSDGMLNALKRFRKHLGQRPALPASYENTNLIPKIKGKGGLTSTRWINQIIQLCFDKAALDLRQQKLFDEAEGLSNATVHWLRHTGISDDINERGRPIAHVRDDAGHSSIATTDRYNDITLQARHASAKSKNMIQESAI